MIDFHTIIILSFTAALIKLTIAGYVYYLNSKSKVNQIFALLFFFQGIWDIGKGLMWLSPLKSSAFLFGKISYAAYIISVFLFAHFCWIYLKRKNIFSKSKLGLTVWYIPMFILIGALFSTNLVLFDLSAPGEVDIGFNLELWVYQYGPMYNYFFFVFQMLPFLYGFIIFIHKFFTSTNLDLKRRLVYIIIGAGFPIIIGIPTGVVLPAIGVRLPPHNNLLTLLMSIFIGIGIIKYKLLSITPNLEKVKKSVKFSDDIKKSNLNYGSSYLIEKPDSIDTSYQFFLYNLYKGNYGFIITERNPAELRKELNIVNTPIAWITEQETDESSFGPNDLEQIFATVESFVKTVKNSFIIVDCIDLLKIHNNFHKIQYFLRRLNALTKQTGACLIVPYGPLHLSKKERIVFKSEFTYVTAKGRMSTLTGSIIDLYQKIPGKERYIVLGYNNVVKALLHEFVRRKISCILVTTENLSINYPPSIKVVKKNPQIKDVLRSLKIDNPHTNIIFSFKSDAETILGINMVRHITDKARVLVKVNTNKFIDIAKKAGANEVIASSEIGGKLLSLSLISPNVVEWFMDSITTRNKLLELEELLITSTSPLKNKSILDADKYFGNAVNILSVSKKGTFDLTTDDSYILKPNDKLIVLIHKDRVKKDKRLNQLFNIK